VGQYHEDLNRKLALIQSLSNAAGAPLVQDQALERKVPIRPDTTVSPSKFLADPLIPGGFKAHPNTIKAMRKDLFVLGEEGFEDLEHFIECASCHETLDMQFWLHCPHCEASFPKQSKS
jgi:hypothetical protein